VKVESWGSLNMVKGCKYLLLLVILPFIWLNQSGLDRISDQTFMLVMTLPPMHQGQTENICPETKLVKAMLVIVGVTRSLHLRGLISFDSAANP
jgi:hypothetical protein